MLRRAVRDPRNLPFMLSVIAALLVVGGGSEVARLKATGVPEGVRLPAAGAPAWAGALCRCKEFVTDGKDIETGAQVLGARLRSFSNRRTNFSV